MARTMRSPSHPLVCMLDTLVILLLLVTAAESRPLSRSDDNFAISNIKCDGTLAAQKSKRLAPCLDAVATRVPLPHEAAIHADGFGVVGSGDRFIKDTRQEAVSIVKEERAEYRVRVQLRGGATQRKERGLEGARKQRHRRMFVRKDASINASGQQSSEKLEAVRDEAQPHADVSVYTLFGHLASLSQWTWCLVFLRSLQMLVAFRLAIRLNAVQHVLELLWTLVVALGLARVLPKRSAAGPEPMPTTAPKPAAPRTPEPSLTPALKPQPGVDVRLVEVVVECTLPEVSVKVARPTGHITPAPHRAPTAATASTLPPAQSPAPAAAPLPVPQPSTPAAPSKVSTNVPGEAVPTKAGADDANQRNASEASLKKCIRKIRKYISRETPSHQELLANLGGALGRMRVLSLQQLLDQGVLQELSGAEKCQSAGYVLGDPAEGRVYKMSPRSTFSAMLLEAAMTVTAVGGLGPIELFYVPPGPEEGIYEGKVGFTMRWMTCSFDKLLRQRASSTAGVSRDEVYGILIAVLKQVLDFDAKHVVHRDIKAGNVFISLTDGSMTGEVEEVLVADVGYPAADCCNPATGKPYTDMRHHATLTHLVTMRMESQRWDMNHEVAGVGGIDWDSDQTAPSLNLGGFGAMVIADVVYRMSKPEGKVLEAVARECFKKGAAATDVLARLQATRDLVV